MRATPAGQSHGQVSRPQPTDRAAAHVHSRNVTGADANRSRAALAGALSATPANYSE